MDKTFREIIPTMTGTYVKQAYALKLKKKIGQEQRQKENYRSQTAV